MARAGKAVANLPIKPLHQRIIILYGWLMKKILTVLGCCGFVVCPAVAGSRWSAETCKHLQEMRSVVLSPPAKYDSFAATQLVPILMHLKNNCGIGTEAEFDANTDLALSVDKRVVRSAPRRQPLLCDTTPKANGGSTTDCF